MRTELNNKKILMVAGSLISLPELREVITRAGAHVVMARSVNEAFGLADEGRFDGVIIDHGLHNEAFDLCIELREGGVPYIYASTPHRLQPEPARRADAVNTAARLGHVLGATEPALDAFIAAPRMHPDPFGRVSHS